MIFPSKTVYLAGPITGLSYSEARNTWRHEIASLLPEHIFPLSPMRNKDFLEDQSVLAGDPNMYPEHSLATPSGIVTRDRNDVRNCDAVVACFLGAMDRVSIGTCLEFGWADAFRKPIVMVIEDGPAVAGGDVNIHLHAFLTEIAGYRVPTLEEAAHLVTHLLTPGV